jgi:hypothetical protein
MRSSASAATGLLLLTEKQVAGARCRFFIESRWHGSRYSRRSCQRAMGEPSARTQARRSLLQSQRTLAVSRRRDCPARMSAANGLRMVSAARRQRRATACSPTISCARSGRGVAASKRPSIASFCETRQGDLVQIAHRVLAAPRAANTRPRARYFSTSTTYLRMILIALSRSGARSAQAFDL